VATEGSALTLARRPPPRARGFLSASAREFKVASCREFEAASGSEFDVATAPCNNLPPLSIDEIVQSEYDQEKEQELYNDFEKILQEQGSNTLLDAPSHDFDSNQYPEIQLCPDTAENSTLAAISELGWSQLAGTPTSQGTTQPPGFFDNVELAELVAAEDPSRALVFNHGWPDLVGETLVCNEKQPKHAIDDTWKLPAKDNCEQLLKLVAAEDPSVALVADHGWADTAVENNIKPTRDLSLTSHQVQTVTLTLPVVSATSLELARGQPLDDALLSVAVEASGLLEAKNSSPGTNNSSADTPNSDRPIINAAKPRPSVIVSTRSRKRALIPAPKMTLDLMVEDGQDDKIQDGVSPAVLEKRRKGNARCKKYRNNKKHKEAKEETELEMLTRRNEFLREEEKRLSERKRKLQQTYLSLIRQKKIRFQ